MRRLLSLVFAAVLAPASASALTVQEVVALTKAGVSEAVLLTMIDRDKTIFAIDANQLIALQRDGVSERVVIAMLKSGRQEPPPAPPSVGVFTGPAYGAGVPYAASFAPMVIGVGHGPDRPNTAHDFDWLGAPRPVGYSPFATPLTYSTFATPYVPVVAPTVPWLGQTQTCAPVQGRRGSSRSSYDARNCRSH